MLIVKIKNKNERSDHARGDYWFQLYVNDTVVTSGDVSSHIRAKGYAALLREVADQIEANGNPKPKDVKP